MTESMKQKAGFVNELLPRYKEIMDRCETAVQAAEYDPPEEDTPAWDRWEERLMAKADQLDLAEEMYYKADQIAEGAFSREEYLDEAVQKLIESSIYYCDEYGGIKRLVQKLCTLAPDSPAVMLAKFYGIVK